MKTRKCWNSDNITTIAIDTTKMKLLGLFMLWFKTIFYCGIVDWLKVIAFLMGFVVSCD